MTSIDDVARAAGVSTATEHLIGLGRRDILHLGGTDDGGFSAGVSRDVMLELFARGPRPTAVFASSDEMAFGVLLAAQQSGLRVPDDLSVIGIDDHDMSASFELMTMAQDPHARGLLAAGAVPAIVRILSGTAPGQAMHLAGRAQTSRRDS